MPIEKSAGTVAWLLLFSASLSSAQELQEYPDDFEHLKQVNWQLPRLSSDYYFGGCGVASMGTIDQVLTNPAGTFTNGAVVRSAMSFGDTKGGLHTFVGYSGRHCAEDGAYCISIIFPSFSFSKEVIEYQEAKLSYDNISFPMGVSFHLGRIAHLGLALLPRWQSACNTSSLFSIPCEDKWKITPSFGAIFTTEGILPGKINRWLRFHIGVARPGVTKTELWRIGYELALVLYDGNYSPNSETYWDRQESMWSVLPASTTWTSLDDGTEVSLVVLQDFDACLDNFDKSYMRGVAFGLRLSFFSWAIWLGGNYHFDFGWGAATYFDFIGGIIRLGIAYYPESFLFEPLAGDADY